MILAVLPDLVAEARLRSALRGEARVQAVHALPAARAALDDDRLRIAALVVAPGDCEGCSTAPLIQLAARRHRPVPVIGSCRRGTEGEAQAQGLLEAGAHGVVFHEGAAGAAELRAALADAEHACAASAILARLRGKVPRALEPMILQAVMYPAHASTVAQVAEALGSSRRTLANLCRRVGAPGPQELLTWARLLLGAQLLAGGRQNVDQVALRLHYPSAGAFRNQCRRYLGRSAAQLREPAGADAAWDAFLARLDGGPPPGSRAPR